ncbi:hypothetical protein HDU84_000072 [Entophlyctis sp. JEL0112]|nr:hypothetical protein HDU84_000072 [Entophlyctis sp. JEL0112]
MATTTIAATGTGLTWDGWGLSLAWWGKAYGSRTDVSDLFFTLNNAVTVGSVTGPGLGLNIARYCAGASSSVQAFGTSMVTPSQADPTRLMDLYWTDWGSRNVSSSSWNWSVDANQRMALQLAKSRGANKFELFANSPPWWMLINKNPCGSTSGTADNLQSWNYDDYAYFLSAIVAEARTTWGITFTSVEPFNEPSASWWKASTSTQEGCHFDVSTQNSVLAALHTEMAALGNTATIISASDESYYSQGVSSISGYSSAAKSIIGRFNVHGYETSGNRAAFRSAAGSKPIWMSEYSESDATGVSLASNIILDFKWLSPRAWIYWQGIDATAGWGLLMASLSDTTSNSFVLNMKHYVFAHFTRHIRQGMTIMSSSHSNSIAAYDQANKKLVVVAMNYGTAQYYNVDLTGFASVNGPIVRWETNCNGGGNLYKQFSDTVVNNDLSYPRFWSYMNVNTIMSFEVSGVSL